jgi:hypothetical protein
VYSIMSREYHADEKAPWTDLHGNARSMQSVLLPSGWYWVSDWNIDHTYPSLDKHGWTAIGETGNALSLLFTASKRRRRWNRVRRRRFDYSSTPASSSAEGDYLEKAEKLFIDSFPGGDLFCSLRTVDENFVLCQRIIELLLNGIKGINVIQ